ncbi:tape measure protein [Brucella anthropi]|uniref:tape measure protein n=1 Tax=Brucella/Ochrobactrum group TaxID=2826938 RepID=UPI00124F3E1E|nr:MULTISPECIES: tape measure protein [Brucella/Ochrobactrum group]KAB2764792.1 tape measure protein [Brucella anthropi]KAB2782537.1 tape measure protein [Brucella anthropi]MCQ9143337.1 tape measure protein [Ochrobactrum sp. BTU2]UGQ23871.1 tape measure protein [Brucella anthropi]
MATDLEKLVVQLAADVKQFERTFNRAVGVSNQKMAQIERRAGQMSKNIEKALNGISFRSLNAALGTVGTAFGAREIAAYADEWTRAGNLIRSAATSAGVEVRSLDELKDSANDARTGLSDYTDLYARLIRSASAVAKSEGEIALATDLVSKSFKAGGAAAQEQAAGILQLGQALGSGVLQGDELRSLRENAPILAKAIADEFKVSIAGLKQLGAEGKLTSDRVFRAILNAQKPIEAQFKATNATIADAFTQVNNEFLAYIGNADASAGASAKLVAALQYVADNFKEVADVAATFATVIITALTGRALGGLAASLVTALGSLGKFLTALRTGVPIATSFAAALGPIGLLAGAAAAAVLLLYNNMASGDTAAQSFTSAVKGNETALNNAASASRAYQAELVKQISLQLEAAKTAEAQANADFNTALQRANAFKKMTGLEFAPFEYATNQAQAQAGILSRAVGDLEVQKKRAEKILASTPSGYGGGIAATPDKDKKGRKKRTPAEKFDRDLQNITDRTTALVAETEAMRQLNPLIDDYGYAIEKARTEQELLNAAQKAGVAITPELRAQIAETANQWALASAEANKLAEAHDKIRQRAEEWRDTEKDAVRGVVDDLIAGKSAADAFADALDKILSKLLDFAFDGIFDSLGKGGGSIWGAIGSLITGKYADGTNSARGGLSLVGERGPELVNLPRGAQVIPNHKLTAPTLPSIQGARQSAASGGMRVDVGVSVDNDGNLQAYVKNVAKQTSQSAIKGYDKSGPARLKRDSRQANMRGMV